MEAEDRENFILLLAELRAAMDSAFGPGRKSLTACASGAPVEPETADVGHACAGGFIGAFADARLAQRL
ncbi:MAG: hypothetical protein ACLU3I_07410 [Acutalibacteraceae bacterium]